MEPSAVSHGPFANGRVVPVRPRSSPDGIIVADRVLLSKHESFLMRPRIDPVSPLTVLRTVFSSFLPSSHSPGCARSSERLWTHRIAGSDPGRGFNNSADAMTEISFLRRTIRLLPNDPDYRLKLAEALLRVGEVDAAH